LTGASGEEIESLGCYHGNADKIYEMENSSAEEQREAKKYCQPQYRQYPMLIGANDGHAL
jgi:hypothetical protein